MKQREIRQMMGLGQEQEENNEGRLIHSLSSNRGINDRENNETPGMLLSLLKEIYYILLSSITTYD
jgi:hypothetical protein